MPSVVENLIRKTVTKSVLQVAAFNRERKSAPLVPHPFLSGIHAPVAREVEIQDLKVQGTIPPELDGRYIRIGPNPLKPANPAVYHWFTGDGMVHGVRLQGGRALWYRNQWIRSKAVSAALNEPDAPGTRRNSNDSDSDNDNVNTNVMGFAGKTWAFVEAGAYPVELDDDLKTISHNPFEGTLKGSFSAHPHLDRATGEMHAICYEGADQKFVRHVVVGKDGKCSDVIWCDVDPCYVFHACNAYETADGKVIVDMAAHEKMFSTPYAMPISYAGEEGVSETHLIKHDLQTGTRQIHEFGANRFPGEFVFVPKSADALEDEGWLMGYVINTAKNAVNETTDLVILNAQDFGGSPQAVITIPHRIPPGFHGNWVPAV